MLLRVVLACLCLAVVARAEPVQTRVPNGLAAIGKPHICDEGYYPPGAVLDNREGDARVSFIITDAGTVKDAQVYSSTGYADLDRATLACVKSWRYKPAMDVGKPVAVPWRAQVSWRITGKENPYATAFWKLRDEAWRCVQASPAAKELPPDFEGIAELYFRFPLIGDPEVRIVQSSGNAALDKQLAACAAKSPWLSAADQESGLSPGLSARFAWYPEPVVPGQ